MNILVGDNEFGKSTILETIHLALTGIINGKYLNTELTQLNYKVVSEAVSAFRASSVPLSVDWKKRIEEDYEDAEERKRKAQNNEAGENIKREFIFG